MIAEEKLANYYRQQQYASGWQDLSALLCTSILAAASDNDGRDFLQRAGAQFACRFPLSPHETLGEMEDEVNQLLARFGWGMVQITVNDRGMGVSHFAWPHAGQESNLSAWSTSFASLMEGCWSEWLRTLGGTEGMRFFVTVAEAEILKFSYQAER